MHLTKCTILGEKIAQEFILSMLRMYCIDRPRVPESSPKTQDHSYLEDVTTATIWCQLNE